MALYYFQYETRPIPDSEINDGIGGAFVNCWIQSDSGVDAAQLAEQAVYDNELEIIEVMEARSVTRSFYRDNEEGLAHFDEAERAGQCIIIYTWPLEEEDQVEDDEEDQS